VVGPWGIVDLLLVVGRGWWCVPLMQHGLASSSSAPAGGAAVPCVAGEEPARGVPAVHVCALIGFSRVVWFVCVFGEVILIRRARASAGAGQAKTKAMDDMWARAWVACRAWRVLRDDTYLSWGQWCSLEIGHNASGFLLNVLVVRSEITRMFVS
jgi:hypothetical protein